jgi:hypothetical protein
MQAREMLWLVIMTILLLPPVAQILHRAGYRRWMAIVVFFPIVNLAFLWVFAFSKWPIDPVSPREADKWSEGDKETFRKMLAEQRKS